MLGAIIGDIIGSTYEARNYRGKDDKRSNSIDIGRIKIGVWIFLSRFLILKKKGVNNGKDRYF